jgi:hypothetical protein
MSITRSSRLCALAGALVLLAGCGGSSSSDSAGNATTSSSTSSTPAASSSAPTASPSPTVTPATVVQLRKIVLQANDLPSSWKATPAEQDNDTSGQDKLMKCVGAKNTEEDKVASADSDDYVLGDATISSSASSYKSQSSVDSDVALLKSPKLTPCFTTLLKKELAASLPEGASLGAVSMKFTPGPGAGPANVAGSGSATVSLTAGEDHVKVYINFVYLTGPLMEAEVYAENIGSPVPAAALQAAVKAVADRAAASNS